MRKHLDSFKQFIIFSVVPYSILAVIFFLGFVVGQNTMHDKCLQRAVEAGHAVWIDENGVPKKDANSGIFMWLDRTHDHTNTYVK